MFCIYRDYLTVYAHCHRPLFSSRVDIRGGSVSHFNILGDNFSTMGGAIGAQSKNNSQPLQSQSIFGCCNSFDCALSPRLLKELQYILVNTIKVGYGIFAASLCSPVPVGAAPWQLLRHRPPFGACPRNLALVPSPSVCSCV